MTDQTMPRRRRHLRTALAAAAGRAAEQAVAIRDLTEQNAALRGEVKAARRELEQTKDEEHRLRGVLIQADAQLEIRTNMITSLEAERDRLRELLAAHEASQKAEAEAAVPGPRPRRSRKLAVAKPEPGTEEGGFVA